MKILSHLVTHYPKAMYHSLHITYQQLNEKEKMMITDIRAKLIDSSQEAFIQALSGLTHPGANL